MTVPVQDDVDIDSPGMIDPAALRIILRITGYTAQLLLHPFADLQQRLGRDSGLEGYGLVEKRLGTQRHAPGLGLEHLRFTDIGKEPGSQLSD